MKREAEAGIWEVENELHGCVRVSSLKNSPLLVPSFLPLPQVRCTCSGQCTISIKRMLLRKGQGKNRYYGKFKMLTKSTTTTTGKSSIQKLWRNKGSKQEIVQWILKSSKLEWWLAFRIIRFSHQLIETQSRCAWMSFESPLMIHDMELIKDHELCEQNHVRSRKLCSLNEGKKWQVKEGKAKMQERECDHTDFRSHQWTRLIFVHWANWMVSRKEKSLHQRDWTGLQSELNVINCKQLSIEQVNDHLIRFCFGECPRGWEQGSCSTHWFYTKISKEQKSRISWLNINLLLNLERFQIISTYMWISSFSDSLLWMASCVQNMWLLHIKSGVIKKLKRKNHCFASHNDCNYFYII